MTMHRCVNGHVFSQPMTITEHTPKGVNTSAIGLSAVQWMEETFQVCPTCKTIEFEAEEDPQPTNVYIYDLTSGAQTELDKLLADGYTIKSTYAKQYHLWKCPQPKSYTQELEDEFLKAAKTAYAKLEQVEKP